ncbi:hypothetical protein [Noviherbaspirillum malthae]|uniref:hypothetical protein n=1 Tax=Noviherbaspirillum malthae TaxID=1260987 RepID=UPI00188E7190|nr:hypothetical protein [Noviherbaspirillum malthae]
MGTLVKHDLEFMLMRNATAERHVVGEHLATIGSNLRLPYGLRTVDGTYNNIVGGRERYGGADQVMPRLLVPDVREAEVNPRTLRAMASKISTVRKKWNSRPAQAMKVTARGWSSTVSMTLAPQGGLDGSPPALPVPRRPAIRNWLNAPQSSAVDRGDVLVGFVDPQKKTDLMRVLSTSMETV